MSDDLCAEIRSVAGAMLNGRNPGEGFDRPLWKDLTGAGFHLLGVPEDAGGSGGGLRELAAVVDLLAFHAAAVPVAESAFLTGWLLSRAGLAVPDGLTVISLDEARGASRLSGRVRAPWGRHADHVVTLARHDDTVLVALVPTAGLPIECAENLAGEPRDTLVLDGVTVARTAVAPPELDAEALLRRGALARSVQLAGAARAVLESARRHVGERKQFGRPLARFQAVQQQLAALAAETVAMQVSADAALLAVEAGDPAAGVAIAAAKATTSASAHVVAAIGHQLHGALGYAQEHRLGAATTRLWAWREEFGNESRWQDELAVGGGDAWWSLVTGGVR
ncbi:acyl-CoA dehydrogenase family protein [Amycolatopsis sp.]|uniref:acyl-CoA dehydrogenase family protein n=1 Tax=Amycolatopsis sp. TaxID=37632 RepID=UPI002D7E630F|nr:acyl-CoA dehydrogenase family protein [Amycolatopsis sp.]HET6709799.1 acyl-CoA dehydrogenase family protein [Amycolatopsis sp.]